MTPKYIDPRQLSLPIPSAFPKAVAWDLGDVLVRLKKTALLKVVEHINKAGNGISIDELQEAIHQELLSRKSPEAERKIKAVKTNQDEFQYWLQFYQSIVNRLDLKHVSKDMIRELTEMQMSPQSFESMPGAIDTLEYLKRAGIRQILISNAFPSANRIIEHLGLSQYFIHMEMSYERSSIKPEPEIYEHALNCAAVAAESTLFVDDRERFVEGARKVGMQALWLNVWDRNNSTNQIKKVRDVLPFAGFLQVAGSLR